MDDEEGVFSRTLPVADVWGEGSQEASAAVAEGFDDECMDSNADTGEVTSMSKDWNWRGAVAAGVAKAPVLSRVAAVRSLSKSLWALYFLKDALVLVLVCTGFC